MAPAVVTTIAPLGSQLIRARFGIQRMTAGATPQQLNVDLLQPRNRAAGGDAAAWATPASRRPFSSGVGGATADVINSWPNSGTNTVLNIVPQGSAHVIERFGKFLRMQPPGLYLAIPLVDRIAYRIDMRERALEIRPQMAITKDNVSLQVSGNVFTRFVDAQTAAYGSVNPLYATYQHARTSPRPALLRFASPHAFQHRPTRADLPVPALMPTANRQSTRRGVDARRHRAAPL